jgi:hypothetical protein
MLSKHPSPPLTPRAKKEGTRMAIEANPSYHIAIAKEFAEVLKEGNCPEVVRLADRLACIFKQDNPAFDRDRFLQACGVDLTLTKIRT